MTRWLSDDEQASWRAYLDATTLLSAGLERALAHDAQMPMSYYEVLVNLSEATDRTLRMNELADRSLSSRSRLSHAVSRMQARGWIVRRPCDDDRRGQLATLSDMGLAALAAAAPGHVASVCALIVDRLTAAEFAELGRISAILRQPLRDEPAPA
jgi:DNA-binding MarR family transcriptional regulator